MSRGKEKPFNTTSAVSWCLLAFIFPTAAQFAQANFVPEIHSIRDRNETVLWRSPQLNYVWVEAGQWLTIEGKNFGPGPKEELSKIMIGKVRVLERDLPMFTGKVNLLQQNFFEVNKLFDQWPSAIQSWTDTRIVFRVPVTAHEGPLVIQRQPSIGLLRALNNPNQVHAVTDPLTERVEGISQQSTTISRVGKSWQSAPIALAVNNPLFPAMVKRGETHFWAFDYNIGLVHQLRGLDWKKILQGKAIDPTTQKRASPEKLFGAIPIRSAKTPLVARYDLYLDPYPIPMPLRGLLPSIKRGWSTPSGFVGYVYNEARHPITQTKGKWIGFNCASCHAQKISYEKYPGQWVSKVFAGIPNPNWSMKWAVLGKFKGIQVKEPDRHGQLRFIDKTQVVYHVPPGTGETSLIRESSDGSLYANDHLFSPIAIPPITRHTPVRRALSHSEVIAGFEGSYVHAQEPDGTIGAMKAQSLKELTTYMTLLDRNHTTLTHLGLYRWLKQNDRLDWIDNVGEATFLATKRESYPRLESEISRGRQVFQQRCERCHQENFGTWTNEDMIALPEVGSYFSPTVFHLKNHSIRVAILRNLYWVQKRGLLHDGHVKSLRDLVHPDRCDESSELYAKYYHLNDDTFKIPLGNTAQSEALKRQAYFVARESDPDHLYWNYQQMRRQFGPLELGTAHSIELPPTPHPWCSESPFDVDSLITFLLTL